MQRLPYRVCQYRSAKTYIQVIMKLSRILLILSFPLLSEVLISCCDCNETVNAHYSNTELLLENLDNSKREILIAGETVPRRAYGIRLLINKKEIACAPSHIGFLPAAYARSCGCPPDVQFLARDSITNIQVFTVNNFNSSYPAQSDVSELFNVFEQQTFSSIYNYLLNKETTIDHELAYQQPVNLLLLSAPAQNTLHSFTVRVTLSDGRVFEKNTTPLIFL